MPLLRAEAEKLSNNDLLAGVVEEIIDRDELFALLPFTQVNAKALVYNREKTLSEGSFIAPVTGVVPEGAATFDEVVAKLRVLAGDVDVDKFLNQTMGDTNNQLAIQIAAKAKGLARKFRRTLAIGDSVANVDEFDGVSKFVVAGQTIDAGVNGAAITLSMLDELLDAVKLGADAVMMRSGTLRAFRNVLRTSGNGTDAYMLQLENFGRPLLGHNGVPIIVNDFLPANEVQGTATATCSVYALRLNEVDGFHGLFGGDSAGIVVENIGTVQDKDATRTRLKWYCGTALRATHSVARIKGITNI